MSNQLLSRNRALAVGSELGVATLLGLFGGSWIDDRLGTSPWFTIIGLAIGAAAGIRSLMRFAPRPTKKLPQNDPPR